jgi:hypothetical protein
MRETSAPVLGRIGRALHQTLDEIVNAPLPERWIDLINRLNAEEDRRTLQALHRNDTRRGGSTKR